MRIIHDGTLPWRELVNAGAEVVEISPVTAGRYFDKMRSSAGPLEVVFGNATFKDNLDDIVSSDDRNDIVSIKEGREALKKMKENQEQKNI